MRKISLAIPALLALAACDNGTQSAGVDTEAAEADGNIVGNSSSSKPSDESTAPEAALTPNAPPSAAETPGARPTAATEHPQ
jgi:hypothetical protein